MSQPGPAYLAVIRTLDATTRWCTYVFALLLVPLVLANTIEVFMRYVLDRPTDWALETTVMSYGALFMLGAAYAMLKGAHVRTDLFWDKFSDRTKGIIDSLAYALLFLPVMAFLPVVQQLDLGLSPQEMMIWFGALVAVNLQTAFLSPPVAMSAYYLKNVVPQWNLSTIYRGMGQFMVIQAICLAAVLLWPSLALWLPRVLQQQ